MAAEFSSCVEYGLNLSKRIYYGKGTAPTVLPSQISRSQEEYLPTAPMAYAVIPEPAIVDNPDVPSYQPYVYGRCEPPPLVPLNLHRIAMEVDCCLDTAFVTVSGTWRVHCIMAGKSCDCRIAVPMGEQGSLLGVEVDVSGRSYCSELITMEDTANMEGVGKVEYGRFLKSWIYTFKIPKVEGGSILSIKMSWSQKLPYKDDQFCLHVPFKFPAYVTPFGKKIDKREKILLHVNSGVAAEVLCGHISHPLKELRRRVGKLSFSYEEAVSAWSSSDFSFSYTVSLGELLGGVLLQPPSLHDSDQRDIFCLYVHPGQGQSRKVFQKEVVFLIDISGSMRGSPLESVKNALLSSLSKFDRQDAFNIIAFNENINLFSSSMEKATENAILKAKQWISTILIASGATNILLPLEQAMKLLPKTTDSIPLIFLITDGAVKDEREICNIMKASFKNGGTTCPRVCTFGIGTFCNHFFLRMLAQIGRGIYDGASDADYIDIRLERLFTTASSIFLANITVDAFEHLDSLELFPYQIPDFSFGSPLIISGRYNGSFPESFKVSGTLADMSKLVLNLKAQRAKDLSLDRVLARRQIDLLTSHAWLLESKDLEEKVTKMSRQTRVPCEYTRMVLMSTNEGKKTPQSGVIQEVCRKFSFSKELSSQKIVFLGSLGIGFGNLSATIENLEPGKEVKLLDKTELLVKAASNCCSRFADRFCCMCFIKTCSSMNDQCAIVLTQICGALACCECLDCCFEICGWF